MTAPENGLGTSPDNGLDEALRHALSAMVSEISPGSDGLTAIRGRIAGRPPRPWLLSVLIAGGERIRYWTWRGHWAWPGSLPRLADLPLPRVRLIPHDAASAGGTARTLPQWNIGWLRPVAVLAGIAVIACVSLGVQPFRQAIIQASSTVLNGGSEPQAGGQGTLGNATHATESMPSAAGHTPGHGSSTASSAGAPISTAVLASPSATAGCAASGTAQSSTASSSGSGTGAQVPGPLMPSPIPSAAPFYSATAAPTCPGANPSSAPSPTTSTSPTPTATTTDTGTPSPSPTPTTTSPSPTPTTGTPTPTVSSSGTPTGSGSPTDTSSPSATPSDTGSGAAVSGNGSSGPTPTASPASS